MGIRFLSFLSVCSLGCTSPAPPDMVPQGIPEATPAVPAEDPGGLLIIGGALRADNAAVYRKLIARAGGSAGARIGIFPTASAGLGSTKRTKATFESYGVPADNVYSIEITSANAAMTAQDPTVVARIKASTALFFVGGDQLKITQAFYNADGSDTPALAAVRDVYANKGVIAGTSAGAAIQSELMLSAFGVPMDTLDVGLSSKPNQRGVYVSKGLGLFHGGVVDQHFNTYQGRHARLSRVLIERKVPLGFGVDEDTAMLVKGDDTFEVVGASGVTVVDTSKAALADAPLGVSISGVLLNFMGSGDSYDLKTGAYALNPSKELIKPGDEYENGNRIITDLAQTGAFNRAITTGLVDNTAKTQLGLLLRYNQTYGYGYKFTFSKTAETQGFYGSVNGIDAYAVRDVGMSVEPVTSSLAPSSAAAPADLAAVTATKEVEAVVFRGILLTDASGSFNPEKPIARGELASAIVNATSLQLSTDSAAMISDVPAGAPFEGEIAIVASRGILDAPGGAFKPDAVVSREELALALKRTVDLYDATDLTGEPGAYQDGDQIGAAHKAAVDAVVEAGLLTAEGGLFRPKDPASREEVAVAVYRLLGFQF